MGLFDRFSRLTAEPTPTTAKTATLAPFTCLVIDGRVQVQLIESPESCISSDDGDASSLCWHDVNTLHVGGNGEGTVVVGGNIINNIHGSLIGSITRSRHLKLSDAPEGHSVSVSSNGQVMIDGRVVSKTGQSVSIINGRVMDDGTGMVIRPRSCTIRTPQLPKIIVKAGSLHVQGFAGQAIDYCVAGSGNIRHDEADTATAKLKVCGSGDVLLGLHGFGRGKTESELQQLHAQLFGSGDIRVCGRAKSADISLSGSGSIHLGDCPVAEARVSLSGSGDIRLNATDSVSGTLIGDGQLALMQEPRERQLTIRGCVVYVINREGTA